MPVRLVLILAAVLLPTSAAWAVTDTFSAPDTRADDQTFTYKLGVYTAQEDSILQSFAPYLAGDAGTELMYAIYEEDGEVNERWNLMWSGDISLPGGEGFVTSPQLNLGITSGRRYLMGIYITERPVSYFFGERSGSSTIWTADGIVWSSPNSTFDLPDPLSDEVDTRFAYHHQVSTTEEGPDNDRDNDGYDVDVDCDDNDPFVHPDANERCNGEDDNCNDEVDENADGIWYADEDNDGWGNDSITFNECNIGERGLASAGGDCDDQNAQVNPGANEDPCGDEDLNCDGEAGDPEECEAQDRIIIDGTCGCGTRSGALPPLTGGAALLLGLVALRGRRPRAC